MKNKILSRIKEKKITTLNDIIKLLKIRKNVAKVKRHITSKKKIVIKVTADLSTKTVETEHK